MWVEWLLPDDIDSNVNEVQQIEAIAEADSAASISTATPPWRRVLSVSTVCVRHRRNRWPLACYVNRKMARFCLRFWSELRFVRANESFTSTTGVDCSTATFHTTEAGPVGKKSTIRRKRYRRVAFVGGVRLSASRSDRSKLPSLSLCNRVGGECVCMLYIDRERLLWLLTF